METDMSNIVNFPAGILIGKVSDISDDSEEGMEIVIPIGYESITVYANGNGDVCIKQSCYGACTDDVIVIVPRLYVDSVHAAMSLIVKDCESVARL